MPAALSLLTKLEVTLNKPPPKSALSYTGVAQELAAHNDARDVATAVRISLVRIGIPLSCRCKAAGSWRLVDMKIVASVDANFGPSLSNELLFFIEINVLRGQRKKLISAYQGGCKVIRQR